MTDAITHQSSEPIREKLEPYLAIIGPMVMILAILLFMGVVEPARYFRATNLLGDHYGLFDQAIRVFGLCGRPDRDRPRSRHGADQRIDYHPSQCA